MAITDTRNWTDLLRERRAAFERAELEEEAQNLCGYLAGVENMTDEQLRDVIAFHRGRASRAT